MHGLTRNSHDFDELAAQLASEFRVVSIDMPGCGRSAWLADPDRYNEATYLAVSRYVISTLALDPVHWVGTSMGGLLGMKFAATEPERVRSLVLNDVGAELDGPELARLRLGARTEVTFDDLSDAEGYFRVRYAEFGPLPTERWQSFTAQSVETMADGRLRPCFDPRAVPNTSSSANVQLWSIWQAVKCPTLVVLGGRSRLITHATRERMANSGPHPSWFEVAEAGHAPDLNGCDRISPITTFLREVRTAIRQGKSV